MLAAPSRSERYSRKDLCRLANLGDGVASFWTKSGLIKPLSGGGGKGNHLQFDRFQVSIAAILAELQKHGLNISRLSAFASLLQNGVKKFDSVPLHPLSMKSAISMKMRLDDFSEGRPVEIMIYHPEAGNADKIERRLAVSEEDIVSEDTRFTQDYNPLNEIEEFARSLHTNEITSLRLYIDLVYELDDKDPGDTSWLIWPEENSWQFADSSEAAGSFSNLPDGLASAIFLGVGAIIRRTWSIDRIERSRARLRERIAFLQPTRPDLANVLERRLRELDE
jgi:DNA-binding transcriptional MerR regulator